MKVEWRREAESRAVLEVELPPEDVARAVEAAHRRLAQRVSIPGFRRGKAPRAIVERYVGRESLIDETLKVLLPDGYSRAVQQAGLRPIGQPEIDVRNEDVTETAPLRFIATVEVAPEVDPGDYRAVRVPREAPVVGNDAVEARLADLRLRRATLVPAGEDPAAPGDFVLVQVLEAAPGLPRLQAGKEYLVEIGAGVHPTALEEGLAGLKRGEQRRVPLGEEHITVAAMDVKRRELPPVDDALARQEGAETLEALRATLGERLQREAAEQVEERYQDAVLRAITDGAAVDLPRSLVAHEEEHLMADLVASLQRRGLTLQTYLRAAEKTEESVRAEFATLAERRLRTQLVLEEIARREGIEPTEEEIAREAENLAQSLRQDVARVQEWLDAEGRREALTRALRRRRTVRFLTDLAADAPGAETA